MRALASLWIASALAASGCGDERAEAVDSCCPPPEERLEPELLTTPDGRCVQRWAEARGCLHVSYDPALDSRAGEIGDVLEMWTVPTGLPCFDPPVALEGPPGDGEHWLHLRPPSALVADDTILIDRPSGIVRQASLELPADEFAQPLVYRVGHILGLERAADGVDSVMAGAPRPTEADLESLAWVYGPDTHCGR